MLAAIHGNSNGFNDLLAVTGALSYDAPVTDEEFWKHIGRALQRRRLDLGMKSTNAVQTAGGPNYKTVAAIEAGMIGEIASLNQYLKTVEMSLVDLFRSVLKIEAEDQSPELEFVIRQFKTAGVVGRGALVSTARLAEFETAPRVTRRGSRPSLDAETAELSDEDFQLVRDAAESLALAHRKKKSAKRG